MGEGRIENAIKAPGLGKWHLSPRECEKRIWGKKGKLSAGPYKFEVTVSHTNYWAYVPHLRRKRQPGHRAWETFPSG